MDHQTPTPEGYTLETFSAEKLTAVTPIPKRKSALWKAVSIILFVLAILSIFISMFIIAAAEAATAPAPFPHMWLFGVTLPLPIASLVFGIVSTARGRRCLKNIIVGAIMTAYLGLVTLMAIVLGGDSALHDDAAILRAEQATSIDIPAHVYVSTNEYDVETDSEVEQRVYLRAHTTVHFDEDVAAEFEAGLAADGRWMNHVPNDLIGLLYNLGDATYYNHQHVVLCNATGGELNQTPARSGKYEFIQLVYDSEEDVLYIMEYVLIYRK